MTVHNCLLHVNAGAWVYGKYGFPTAGQWREKHCLWLPKGSDQAVEGAHHRAALS